MPLTDTAIKAIKPLERPAKYSDSGGLHLLVSTNGSKLWRLAYRFEGKQKTLALGSYPVCSLLEARRKRDTAKKHIADISDPSEQLKLQKIASQAEARNSFELIAEEMLVKSEKEGRAPATLNKNRWLLSLALPDIGKRPIDKISAFEILTSLRKVEAKGNYETARRLRAIIGQVFRYAIATARAENDPTFGLRGALINPIVVNRPAMTKPKDVADLMRAVWGYEGTPEVRAALQLMALLYPRPRELRNAHWSEFDFDAGVWSIPAKRAKMRREHRKPLPKIAIDVLREVLELTGNGLLVFPSIRSPGRPMSENTLNAALRRLGYTKDQATAHGFRATASTLLNESGKWSPDAIEVELAHVGADEVRRAYHRATYWDERVKMADWWAVKVTDSL